VTKASSRGERLRRWFAEQTPVSLTIATLGAAGLTTLVVGSAVFLTVHGLTPAERLIAGITSDTQALLLWAAIGMGLVGLVGGIAMYRRMPTKGARNGAVSGAVLGAQAVAFALVYLWFRTGNPDVFVNNFLNFEKLEGLGGGFVQGAKNTVILALAGEALGIGIGLLLGLFVLSNRRSVRAPARVYINFFRGTPLVWQVIFFSVFFLVGFGLFRRNPFGIAILVLGANAGAYTAEVFRAGIQSIERGQLEAARSLGMSYLQAMRYAILPQAFRRVIPPLTNEFVILIKDTSLVFVLGLTAVQRELLQVGRDAYAETFNATPYLGTAIGYLIVTLPMIRFVTWLEKKLRSGLVGVGA